LQAFDSDTGVTHKGQDDASGDGTPAPPMPPLIGLKCPGCGQNLKVRAELTGKNVVCPKCRQHVLVPAIKVAGT
jgi:DNA-directed RNA polymerase subunit RPC12/RpoP